MPSAKQQEIPSSSRSFVTTCEELRQILEVCRANGVKSLAMGDLLIELGGLGAPQAKAVQSIALDDSFTPSPREQSDVVKWAQEHASPMTDAQRYAERLRNDYTQWQNAVAPPVFPEESP